jgi:hypothetical protein
LDCRDEEMRDSQYVDYAIRQLNQKHDRPFFIACGLTKPHLPWSVPKKYYETFPLESIQLPPFKEDDLDDLPLIAREFVNRINDVKPLSSSERRAILSFLETGVDLDDVLRRAVRLLAQLTRQVAIVQYPTLSASTVRHLEVVALTPARLLMVVITDSGRVDQRIVELGDTIDDHQLSRLRELLGQALHGAHRGVGVETTEAAQVPRDTTGGQRARARLSLGGTARAARLLATAHLIGVLRVAVGYAVGEQHHHVEPTIVFAERGRGGDEIERGSGGCAPVRVE